MTRARSYKTTLAGLLAGAATIAHELAVAADRGDFDGKSVAGIVSGVFLIALGVFARDWNVSSEGAVVKPEAAPPADEKSKSEP